MPEPVGYCHGSLASAAHLANHEVCMGAPADDPSTPDVDESLGSTENVSTQRLGTHAGMMCLRGMMFMNSLVFAFTASGSDSGSYPYAPQAVPRKHKHVAIYISLS